MSDSFKSLPDWGINDILDDPSPPASKPDETVQVSNGNTSTSTPLSSATANSRTSTTNLNSKSDSNQPIDIITTLGVYPETKDQVEDHLIKLGKQVEAEEPDCLQWEVFYLSATGELVLIERFKNLAAAEYHWQMEYNQNVLRFLTDQGWLSGHPDMKRLKSRGGFAFRSRLTTLN